MATAITHFYWAQRVLKEGAVGQSRNLFLVGTSFPDCRYLAKLPRELTHRGGRDFSSINQAEPFEAGIRFHHWLDRQRNLKLEAELVAQGYPRENSFFLAVKNWEDTYFYPKIEDLKSYFPIFEKVYPQELAIVNRRLADKWHELLVKYFRQRPNPESMKKFMLGVGMSEEVVEKTLTWFEKIKTDKVIQRLVVSFYDQLQFG